MSLNDLLVSYKKIQPPSVNLPSLPETYDLFLPTVQQHSYKLPEESQQSVLHNQPQQSSIRGTQEFEQAYDEVEKRNPEAKKYRQFLTMMAQKESGFNKSIQNLAGAPAYGYFQFMQDGKKYNNITAFAGTDIETFRNNPQLQIEAAIKLAKSFEKGFTQKDKEKAKEKGITTFGLLGGAWLGGVGGVRTYLNGKGNPSDKHWSKEKKGTTVADRIRAFNFKRGGHITMEIPTRKVN